MKLLLIRHGESLGNKQKQIYGRTDYTLTPKGIIQSRAIADYLNSKNINRIYYSPLKRTKYITTLVNTTSIPLIEESWLSEMDFGIFEALTPKEASLKYPCEYNNYLNNYQSYTIPEGDNYLSFCERIKNNLEKNLPSKTEVFAFITHGEVIRVILSLLTEMSFAELWSLKLPPASVIELIFENNSYKIQSVFYG